MEDNAVMVEATGSPLEREKGIWLKVRADFGEGELILSPRWRESAVVIREGVKLLLLYPRKDGSTLFLDGEGLLVLEPGYLVEPTRISSFAICPLLPRLEDQFSSPLTYHQVLGRLVHLLFSKVVLSKKRIDIVQEARKIIVKEKRGMTQLPRLPSDEGLLLDILDTIEPIIPWVSEMKVKYARLKRGVEFSLSSSRLGIKGRIDAIFLDEARKKAVVMELKSGGAKGFSSYEEHRIQLLSYLLLVQEEMFQGQGELEGFVLYCGEREIFPERRVILSRERASEIMNLRNRFVASRLSLYRPEAHLRWHRCFKCSYLAYCEIGERRLGGIKR